MKKLFLTTLMIVVFTTLAFSQNLPKTGSVKIKDTMPYYKFSVSSTCLTFANSGPEETNTHHYEFHIGYRFTPKDKIGIKVATWSLFEPMGIPWGPYLMNESELYPGRIKETGIRITYQYLLWKV